MVAEDTRDKHKWYCITRIHMRTVQTCGTATVRATQQAILASILQAELHRQLAWRAASTAYRQPAETPAGQLLLLLTGFIAPASLQMHACA
jgi:hypothetical protein